VSYYLQAGGPFEMVATKTTKQATIKISSVWLSPK